MPRQEPLKWPPLAEDLRRLYLEEKLSASKIAKVYGLKYASEKTAESTILYHLRKNGISRRDPAAHMRKVTEEMVDEWVVRYQKGESLKRIAGDAVDSVTVFNHLHKRGLQLRDKVDAQIAAVTKHTKRPFDGSPEDWAYLVGFTVGDFHVTRHGRSIRVKTSTTHPAMMDLVLRSFERYAAVYRYPKEDRVTGYEWSVDCDLDRTFEFLERRNLNEIFSSARLFLSFLAGFFDAEGSIYLHKKRMKGAFEISIANKNLELLQGMANALRKFGYSPHLRKIRQKENRGMGREGDMLFVLHIWKYTEVQRFLTDVRPRNSEKVRKAALAQLLPSRASLADFQRIEGRWSQLLSDIKSEREQFIASARFTYLHNHSNRSDESKSEYSSDDLLEPKMRL